jgi:hypothetical protein
MKTLKRIVFSAGVIALSALFGTAEVSGQSPIDTCTGGVYTVNLLSVVPGNPGTTLWNYNLSGSGPNLNKVSEVVMIIPRPVTPTSADIISPAPTLNYCQERDSSSKINRGNCGGFPLPIGIAVNGNNRTFSVTTSDKITSAIVSVNVVSGSAGNDVCVKSGPGNLLTGILGPGNVGDPNLILQTVRTFERINSLGVHCTTTFTLDSAGNVLSASRTCNNGNNSNNLGKPFSNIQITVNNGTTIETGVLKQLGRFDDFTEFLSGENSSCTISYRGVLYQVC